MVFFLLVLMLWHQKNESLSAPSLKLIMICDLAYESNPKMEKNIENSDYICLLGILTLRKTHTGLFFKTNTGIEAGILG